MNVVYDSFLDSQWIEHGEVLQKTKLAVREPFAKLVTSAIDSVRAGGKIVFFGNGGSAADAQHLAAELVVRYTRNRRAIAALALTTDSSILTACANDFSYDDIFARQIEALCDPKDLCIGISTSGNSPNVLKALEAARVKGAVAAGLSGRDGGKMLGVADPLVIVPSAVTARIQEMHILLGHILCDLIETEIAQN